MKKRYFQIKIVEAASIRGLILEPRYRPLNNEYQQDENHRILTNGDRFHSECLNCKECGNLIETNDFFETE